MTAPAQSLSALRWRLILNGKCAGSDPVRDAVKDLRRRGIDLGVRVTWEHGDAERYVGEAVADGVDTVVAAGGDGTLSAVAGALAAREERAERLPSLGVVPLGTANDFAAAAQLPTDIAAAFEIVRANPAQAVDLLRIETADSERVWWCANLASGGFGTQVTVETDEGLKKLLGGLAYLITGISRLGRIEPIHARMQAPDFQWQGNFIALGIGNGRQAGGGQVLCPDAVIDDDLLDLTIVPELVGEVGTTVGALLTQGRQGALDRVALRRQLPWLKIESDKPFTLNLDGEPCASTRFHIDCIAARVRMHLPPGCPLLRLPGNPLRVSGRDQHRGPSPAMVPA